MVKKEARNSVISICTDTSCQNDVVNTVNLGFKGTLFLSSVVIRCSGYLVFGVHHFLYIWSDSLPDKGFVAMTWTLKKDNMESFSTSILNLIFEKKVLI